MPTFRFACSRRNFSCRNLSKLALLALTIAMGAHIGEANAEDAACSGGLLTLQPGSVLDEGYTGIAHGSELTAGASIGFSVLRRCSDDNSPCGTNSDCSNGQCVPTCDC